MTDQAPDHQAREFAAAFRDFLDWVHSPAAGAGGRNEVSALVRDFLGPDGARHSVVTRELAPFEHVNLQTAVDAWSAQRRPDGGGPRHRRCRRTTACLALQQLVAGEALPPLRLTAPALADLPNGPDSTLGCLRLAVLLVTDEHGRYVVMIQAPSEHLPSLQVEVAGLPVDVAQRAARRAGPAPRRAQRLPRPPARRVARTRWAASSSPSPARRASAGTTWCCRTPCWPGSSGTRSASPPTGRRCSPPGSTSSAACCSTGRPAPARRTPPATCWAR